MKKTAKLLSAITMALVTGALTISASAAASHNYRGDINRDDKVNVADLVALNKHFAGLSYIPEKNIVYADMDGNGKLNVIDFMCLKRAIMTGAAPEEIEAVPAVTTTAVTTKAAVTTTTTKATTAAATSSTTKATTAASTSSTTKATTEAATSSTTTTTTTKATTTTTSTAKATTTTTTSATTTTTTTTTKATTTTTTTTTTTPAASETTTTEATTPAKTYPSKVGNGVNDLADVSQDRAWIVLGGEIEKCDYVVNEGDFVPGSVKMPAITGDGDYTASFYVYDEALAPHGGSITYAYLRVLKGGTWQTYTLSEKPDLKLTVTGATVDGQRVSADKISALTQANNAAAVEIQNILGPVNNVEIEFNVEGFDSTGSTTPETPSNVSSIASADKDRISAYGYFLYDGEWGLDYQNAFEIGKDNNTGEGANYSKLADGSVIPELTGNGTYKVKIKVDRTYTHINYLYFYLDGAGTKPLVQDEWGYNNTIAISVDKIVVDGTEKSTSDVTINNKDWGGCRASNILPEDTTVNDYIEVTITVSGM